MGKYDERTALSLGSVNPRLSNLVSVGIAKLALEGVNLVVTDGLRTFAAQDELYHVGRSGPRSGERRVTNARGGQSNHNYGMAVDIAIIDEKGSISWDTNIAAVRRGFKRMSEVMKGLGLESGADWRFSDLPHVQLKGMGIKQCYYYYVNGFDGLHGVKGVWVAYQKGDEAAIKGKTRPAIVLPKGSPVQELIELGDTGASVRQLQQDLVRLGFLREHEVDGDFGKITRNALISFQRLNNLTSDGIAGPGTSEMIKSALNSAAVLSQNVSVVENTRSVRVAWAGLDAVNISPPNEDGSITVTPELHE